MLNHADKITMSKIGSLGSDVVFVVVETGVSNQWQPIVRTIDDFNRTASGRWAQHDILGKKPKKQYLGPGLDTVSFSVRFSASLGLNPRKELDRLINIEREGKALPLVIGRKPVGVGLWVITSLSQDWERLDNMGNVLDAQVNITLEEYVK